MSREVCIHGRQITVVCEECAAEVDEYAQKTLMYDSYSLCVLLLQSPLYQEDPEIHDQVDTVLSDIRGLDPEMSLFKT